MAGLLDQLGSASVVMAQAFGVPAFPRDTWNRRHLQIIYFGREFCPARRHSFAGCPICSFAASKAQELAETKAQARPRGRK